MAFEWEDLQRKRAQKRDKLAFIAQLEASDDVHDRIKAVRCVCVCARARVRVCGCSRTQEIWLGV